MTDYFTLPSDVPWALYLANKVVAKGSGVATLLDAVEATYHVRPRQTESTGLDAIAFRAPGSRRIVQLWVCDRASQPVALEGLATSTPAGMETELGAADLFLRSEQGLPSDKQSIPDKLHALELSALTGRNALSLGGVDEQGVRKLLGRLAEHLNELTDMVGSLCDSDALGVSATAPGRLDATAPARIWLQVDTSVLNSDRASTFPESHEGVSWCQESIGGLEVQYVRLDLVHRYMHPMASAPMDGTPVLLKFKSAGGLPEKLEAMADRWFVGANRGDAIEWSFAAPVGYGGIPSDRLAGWMPLQDEIRPCGSSRLSGNFG